MDTQSPRSFVDIEQVEWHVSITVNDVKRCKQALGLNLASEAVDGGLFAKLASDPVLLVDVLYVLCKAEADERSVTDEEFGRRMIGDTLEDAANALARALADFFPKRRRELLHKMLKQTKELEAAAMTAAEKWLADGTATAKLQEQIDRLTSSPSATDTPESSE